MKYPIKNVIAAKKLQKATLVKAFNGIFAIFILLLYATIVVSDIPNDTPIIVLKKSTFASR